MLSGLESGGINVQSVRHDEGKIITCLRKHTSAVSVLTLANDEKSVLSGSWDKAVYDWDLYTGQLIREYIGSAGQISTVQFRPVGENTVPVPRQTIQLNGVSGGSRAGLTNGVRAAGLTNGVNGTNGDSQDTSSSGPAQAASPAESHDSLFGDDPDFDDDEFSAAVAANGMTNGNNDGADDERMEDAPPPHGGSSNGDAGSGAGDAGDEQQAPTNGLDMDMDDTDALFGDDILTNPLEPHIPAPTSNGNGHSSQYPHSPPPQASQTDTDTSPNNTTTATTTTTAATTTITTTHNSMTTSFNHTHPHSHDHDPSPPSPSSPSSPSNPETQPHTFLTSSIDGTLRIWDRRQPLPVAVAYPQKGVPPWCMSAGWSTDGNYVYAGRRNCTVEEYSVHKGFVEPVRTLRFPQGSGPVTAVTSMPSGRHLLW